MTENEDEKFDDGDGSFVCTADRFIDLALFFADRAVEDGAGHIAPVVTKRSADVQNDAVARLQNGGVGIVVRIGSVFAHAYDGKSKRIASVFLKEVFYLGGKFALGCAFVYSVDDHIHAGVVDAGSVAHQLALLFILVHGSLLDRQRTHDRLHVGTVRHQTNQEAAGPGFVDAQFAGLHALCQLGNRIVAVGVFHQLHPFLWLYAEQLVSKEGDLAAAVDVHRHHSLQRCDPDSGQIVDRFGFGDDDLLQTRFFHVFQNLLQSFLIHINILP